jgi:hypothetical protein
VRPAWPLFQTYCCEAYNILRKSANLLLSLFHLMAGASIPDIQSDPEKAMLKLQVCVMRWIDGCVCLWLRSWRYGTMLTQTVLRVRVMRARPRPGVAACGCLPGGVSGGRGFCPLHTCRNAPIA